MKINCEFIINLGDLNWLEFLIQNYVEYSEYLPDVELLHFAADKSTLQM